MKGWFRGSEAITIGDKATAEANASAGIINVQKPSLTISPTLSIQHTGGSKGKQPFPVRFLQEVARLRDPVGCATDEARALAIRSKALTDACERYRAVFPTFTDSQICLLAFGYTMTAAEADNIADVLFRTAGKLPADASPDNLPPDCVDKDIKGAATAYEEELRDMWSSLIAGEINEGAACLKRTKHALREMSPADVQAFKTLCSYSPWAKVGPSMIETPIPVLASIDGESWTRNGGTVVGDDLGTFSSLGLIDTSRWTTFTFTGRQRVTFEIKNIRIVMTGCREGAEEQKVSIGNAMFLPSGIELAKICNASPAEDLRIMLKKAAGDVDIRIEEKH